ncbi:tRNA dimethylallyltransferase [Actinopolyspora xinjiangensis]|uniref:tRNA dimethylallyltransferase n=1 Tax=Actinopolyspora xinjiangensis TaxID=405564 RepID=A0A1H0THY8_9ACTN|nr:tRNA (adenosine(37)-N6)-dimethylallyltransferase MiaA [Actinopolyspora xinjiangensis]SDP53657.1 tRNA dimethylallyltransferase [Actinopolyspora xinjiangensis]
MPATTPRPVAVLGPTATGKSELALRLAELLDGEVVNADAMQLYRGMDIGTAKLPPQARHGVPHHQLDVLDVTETASVAAYQRHARADVERLLESGTTPILVGGSGLYVQAVLDELNFPGTDPSVRQRWQRRLDRIGTEALHRELAELDPPAAESIPPSNGRRVVRAMEVIELTGRRFSANLPAPGPPRYDTLLVGLDRPVGELDARVNTRAAEMFDEGLVDEVRGLERLGLRRGRTASRALGYQQVLAELDEAGDMTAAAAETARATRRFVRRQRSWFRRDGRIHWFDANRADLVAEISRLRRHVDPW